jgi:probable F420-dependent oxidoreductase
MSKHRSEAEARSSHAAERRYGVTVPFDNVALQDQRDWFEEAAELGYSDLWSSEAGGTDAFTPLALAAAWVPSLRLGCAIVPAFTRGPGLMAMSVASMAEAAPGRFAFGIGTSSDVIVERWNGIPFEEPYKRTRDMVRFLRAALSNEKVDRQYETFSVEGFRLGRRLDPAAIPPILVAALRPGMLRLAGREGDGAIINWLSADDVRTVVPYVGKGKEVVARIFVCPSDDAEAVRAMGRFAIAAYLNVPVYAAFHEWLGRGDALEAMWANWRAGERKAAVAAIPDEIVDQLIVHGSPEACRAHVGRYLDNGVTTAALALLPLSGSVDDARQALRVLSPTEGAAPRT